MGLPTSVTRILQVGTIFRAFQLQKPLQGRKRKRKGNKSETAKAWSKWSMRYPIQALRWMTFTECSATDFGEDVDFVSKYKMEIFHCVCSMFICLSCYRWNNLLKVKECFLVQMFSCSCIRVLLTLSSQRSRPSFTSSLIFRADTAIRQRLKLVMHTVLH